MYSSHCICTSHWVWHGHYQVHWLSNLWRKPVITFCLVCSLSVTILWFYSYSRGAQLCISELLYFPNYTFLKNESAWLGRTSERIWTISTEKRRWQHVRYSFSIWDKKQIMWTKDMIRYAHMATILFHIVVSIMLFIFIANGKTIESYIVNTIFLLVTLMSILPMIQYSCQNNAICPSKSP